MAKIAFLVYKKDLKNSKRGRKETFSFDGQSNVGVYMIRDVLARGGIETVFCDPSTASQYDFVLVSFTSSYDVYNFIKAVGRLQSWQKGKRTFKVVIGGFGVHNITPLRHLVDFAFFGRVEDVFWADMQELIASGDIQRPYVMRLHETIHPVTMHQSLSCYPYALNVKPNVYSEIEIGCPRKCLFCFFSFSRQHIKTHNEAFKGAMQYAGGSELIFNEILKLYAHPESITNLPTGKIRTAIDGFSERLRMAFNKRYTNEMIIETLSELSQMWQGKLVYMAVYMIGNYPTETQDDRQELIDTLSRVKITNKEIVVELHVSPFRPSCLTPSQWLPADISLSWNNVAETWLQKGIDTRERAVFKKGGMKVSWSAYQESSFSHAQSLFVERATESTDPLINTILFSPPFNALHVQQKMMTIQRLFDLTPLYINI